METFKTFLFIVIILMVLGILGYWAFFTIESGGTHAEKQKIETLEDENEALRNEVEELKDKIATLEIEEPQTPTPAEPSAPVYNTPATTPITGTTTKNETLIKELQKLIDDKVYMKEKSKGTRVGTIQNFLNLYFKTSKKVDNDYGATTKADIMKFQKAEGLTADGEAGPTTFQKMIDWLKKQ